MGQVFGCCSRPSSAKADDGLEVYKKFDPEPPTYADELRAKVDVIRSIINVGLEGHFKKGVTPENNKEIATTILAEVEKSAEAGDLIWGRTITMVLWDEADKYVSTQQAGARHYAREVMMKYCKEQAMQIRKELIKRLGVSENAVTTAVHSFPIRMEVSVSLSFSMGLTSGRSPLVSPIAPPLWYPRAPPTTSSLIQKLF